MDIIGTIILLYETRTLSEQRDEGGPIQRITGFAGLNDWQDWGGPTTLRRMRIFVTYINGVTQKQRPTKQWVVHFGQQYLRVIGG